MGDVEIKSRPRRLDGRVECAHDIAQAQRLPDPINPARQLCETQLVPVKMSAGDIEWRSSSNRFCSQVHRPVYANERGRNQIDREQSPRSRICRCAACDVIRIQGAEAVRDIKFLVAQVHGNA